MWKFNYPYYLYKIVAHTHTSIVASILLGLILDLQNVSDLQIDPVPPLRKSINPDTLLGVDTLGGQSEAVLFALDKWLDSGHPVPDAHQHVDPGIRSHEVWILQKLVSQSQSFGGDFVVCRPSQLDETTAVVGLVRETDTIVVEPQAAVTF